MNWIKEDNPKFLSLEKDAYLNCRWFYANSNPEHTTARIVMISVKAFYMRIQCIAISYLEWEADSRLDSKQFKPI